MVELDKNYVEFLEDEPPNPFKSLHIPYIKIPEKKKRRNFYEVSNIDKGKIIIKKKIHYILALYIDLFLSFNFLYIYL